MIALFLLLLGIICVILFWYNSPSKQRYEGQKTKMNFPSNIVSTLAVKPRASPQVFPPELGCEPYPGVFIGNAEFARNMPLLKNLGITHVINCAQEIPNFHEGLPEAPSYLHLNLDDIPTQNIQQYFTQTYNFIQSILSKGGKVLIHCAMGISRSVTILLYFLMNAEKISAGEALDRVRRCRPIANPNPGFMEQLRLSSPSENNYIRTFP